MVHRPKLDEKFFFLLSGAVVSTPFPSFFNSLINYFFLYNLPEYQAVIISIVVIAPILEEFAKAYPLFYRHGETERSLMQLGFLTGLGFGIAEFFIYVFVLGASINVRLPLLLFHATNTTIVAYGIGKKQVTIYFAIAVGLHFINNLFAQMGLWLIGGLGAVVISYLVAGLLYSRAREVEIPIE